MNPREEGGAPLTAERVVHRYCGRELGGHVGVAQVQPLAPELERLVQRRSDLSGEDLGRPVGPYLSGYPLPDGRYALARTRYLTDADCLGAVRTETMLLPPAARAALSDPLAAQEAFGPEPDLAGELSEYRARRAARPLAPLTVALPAPRRLAARLAPLLALSAPARGALLEAVCGPLPVALVGGGPPLLEALLALHPPGGAWQVGFSTCALSPREWAELALVPPDARDRFALRAARERDVALVDVGPGGAAPVNVGPSAAAERLRELVETGAGEELERLLATAARASGGYARPRDLNAHLRVEALRALPRRAPEQQVELANLLRARGAPPAEQAAPFRELLRDPPQGRLPWLVNVLRAGWLPYRREHAQGGDPEEPGQVALVLTQALAAGRADLARAFVLDAQGLYPEVEAALCQAALSGLEEGAAASSGAASEAQALLALEAARGDPAAAARLARALLRHDPPEGVLLQLLPLLAGAPPGDRDAARVAVLGAAQAQGHATALAAALQALDPRDTADDALGCAWALAASSPMVEPVVLARAAGTLELSRRLPLEGLLRGARGRPEAVRAAGGALLRRADLETPAAARALARLRAVARRTGEQGLARAAAAALMRLRRAVRGPLALLERAAQRARRGAFAPAAAALAAALELPAAEGGETAAGGSAEGRRPTGVLVSGLDAATPAPPADEGAGGTRTGVLAAGTADEAARTGALGPDALADDPAGLGEDEAARTGALGPGALGPDALAPDALAPDALAPDALAPDALADDPRDPPDDEDTGAFSPRTPPAPAHDPSLAPALREVLGAVAAGLSHDADRRARQVLDLLPDAAWEVELPLLAALLPLYAPDDPALTGHLRRAAGRALASDPQAAAQAAGAAPPLVAALVAALLAGAPPAGDARGFLRAAHALARGPGAAQLPRPALAAAVARAVEALRPRERRSAAGEPPAAAFGDGGSAAAFGDGGSAAAPVDLLLLEEVLWLVRTLDQPVAWSALLGLALAARIPPPALLEPALAALPARPDPALVARLAARVEDGGVDLEALSALAPATLDAVLAALPGGFSLRLQNGLRGLALALAERPDLDGLAGLEVALRHLQPRVAPDRAFRQELAQALSARLGGRARGELARALGALAR